MDPSVRPVTNPWIVSAAWDSAFIVGSPLVIIPAVLLAAGAFTPESISIFAFAFATMGHHLPGYLRCYGDRSLFDRFRWRLLLLPPLVLGAALLFSMPGLFGIEHPAFKGMTLVIMLWGVWHGMMQAYGFTRMYEVKREHGDASPTQLDLAFCGATFALGVVLSDSRMVSLADTFWMVGFPVVGPEWLTAIRTVVVSLATLIGIAWGVTFWRNGVWKDVSGWMKLATIGSSGIIYVFSGHITTNVLVGVAAFEIFHALQYDAISWIYNRKLRDRVGSEFGPLGFLFRDHWSMLALYAAMILAFGSVYLFAADPRGYALNDGLVLSETALAVLSAIFITSNILHFYVDGFIWKVRETQNRQTLGIGPVGSDSVRIDVTAAMHAGKWGGFFTLIALLLTMELRTPNTVEALTERRETLSAWAPELPAIQSQVAKRALESGDFSLAIEMAQAVTEKRPRSHTGWALLGTAHSRAGDLEAAAAAFETALELFPSSDNHARLAEALDQRGARWQTGAEIHYVEAIQKSPEDARLHRKLGWMQFRRERWDAAERAYQAAVRLEPDHAQSRVNLGIALRRLGRPDEARVQFDEAARLGLPLPPQS